MYKIVKNKMDCEITL